MSQQLLQEVSDNLQLATVVHRELADTFYFIGLVGYSYFHEYQNLSELCDQRKIKQYITKTYHAYISDTNPKGANIAEPLIGNKNRKQLKVQETWDIVQQLWKIHRDWETDSLKLYEKIATQLHSQGSISAFNFVTGLISDVKIELDFVNDKITELSAMDWDLPQIISEQTNYYERYERLIRELLGKSQHYHRHNSALDPESRMSIFEKSPD